MNCNFPFTSKYKYRTLSSLEKLLPKSSALALLSRNQAVFSSVLHWQQLLDTLIHLRQTPLIQEGAIFKQHCCAIVKSNTWWHLSNVRSSQQTQNLIENTRMVIFAGIYLWHGYLHVNNYFSLMFHWATVSQSWALISGSHHYWCFHLLRNQ